MRGGRELVALHTPGHTPGHLCFYERTTGTLFSGDHVLSFINTSPGLRPHSTADPVGDYLGSFDRLRTWTWSACCQDTSGRSSTWVRGWTSCANITSNEWPKAAACWPTGGPRHGT